MTSGLENFHFHQEIRHENDEREAELYRAQGMDARRAETGTGSVHDSPVPQECAQDTPAKQHKD